MSGKQQEYLVAYIGVSILIFH